MSSNSPRVFFKAFLINFLPLFIFYLPLLFHRSEAPQIGPYSVRYFVLLSGVFIILLLLCFAVAFKARRDKSLDAAFIGFVSIVTVFACFVSVEIQFRMKNDDNFAGYRSWGHKKSIIFGFEQLLNAVWYWKGVDAARPVKFTTDESGFRVHLSDPDWRNNEKAERVFVIGASSVFGCGLNDDETWPHRLEAELPGHAGVKRPVYVINAGNNGYFSNQTLLRLYFKVLMFKPDFVIFYENHNDISSTKLEPTQISLTEDMLFSQTVAQYWAKQRRGENIYNQTLIAKYLDTYFGKKKPLQGKKEEKKDYQDIFDHNAGLYMRNVAAMHNLCRMSGTQFVISTFIHNPEKMSPALSSGIKAHNELLRRFSEKEGVPLIDIEKAFEGVTDKHRYFFEDSYHPNADGARFIAEVAAKGMKEILNKRADGAPEEGKVSVNEM